MVFNKNDYCVCVCVRACVYIYISIHKGTYLSTIKKKKTIRFKVSL